MTRSLTVCGAALVFALAAHAKAPPAGKSPKGGAEGQKLDEQAMRATSCVVKAADLKPMPGVIGTASLPRDLQSKLGLIFEVKQRKTAQPAPKSCQGMKPLYFVQGRGNGSVKSAYVATVLKPFDVWRGYSGKPAFCSQASRDGRWWSLSDPRTLGKATYRARNGICESWNTLSHVVRCTLKPGTPIAIGPTESVTKKKCSCSAEDRAKWGDKEAGPYDPSLPAYSHNDHVSKQASFSYDEDDHVLQVFIDTKGKLKTLTSKCQDFTWH